MDAKDLELKNSLANMLKGMALDAENIQSRRDLWNVLMVLQEKVNRGITTFYTV